MKQADFVCGGVIEGVYIACKLSLAAGTGEKLVPLFNEQTARLDKSWKVLEAYAADPELDTLAERPQRERIIKPVTDDQEGQPGRSRHKEDSLNHRAGVQQGSL
jgi:hypothetical protein